MLALHLTLIILDSMFAQSFSHLLINQSVPQLLDFLTHSLFQLFESLIQLESLFQLLAQQ